MWLSFLWYDPNQSQRNPKTNGLILQWKYTTRCGTKSVIKCWSLGQLFKRWTLFTRNTWIYPRRVNIIMNIVLIISKECCIQDYCLNSSSKNNVSIYLKRYITTELGLFDPMITKKTIWIFYWIKKNIEKISKWKINIRRFVVILTPNEANLFVTCSGFRFGRDGWSYLFCRIGMFEITSISFFLNRPRRLLSAVVHDLWLIVGLMRSLGIMVRKWWLRGWEGRSSLRTCFSLFFFFGLEGFCQLGILLSSLRNMCLELTLSLQCYLWDCSW